jgi:polyisoprenoid-binding protein YceI
MRRSASSSLLAFAIAALGCKADAVKPEADKTVTPVATGSAPPATTPPATTTAAAPGTQKTLALDPVASTFPIVASKVTGSHNGSFKKFSGTASVAGDEVQAVSFEVETASVETDTPKLTQHVKSKDFLEVDKYPKATFQSTSIKKTPGGPGTHEVTGDLTLHGIKESITFPVTVKQTPQALTGEGKITIDRQKFNIKYPGMPDDLIKDEVVLAPTFVFPNT